MFLDFSTNYLFRKLSKVKRGTFRWVFLSSMPCSILLQVIFFWSVHKTFSLRKYFICVVIIEREFVINRYLQKHKPLLVGRQCSIGLAVPTRSYTIIILRKKRFFIKSKKDLPLGAIPDPFVAPEKQGFVSDFCWCGWSYHRIRSGTCSTFVRSTRRRTL